MTKPLPLGGADATAGRDELVGVEEDDDPPAGPGAGPYICANDRVGRARATKDARE